MLDWNVLPFSFFLKFRNVKRLHEIGIYRESEKKKHEIRKYGWHEMNGRKIDVPAFKLNRQHLEGWKIMSSKCGDWNESVSSGRSQLGYEEIRCARIRFIPAIFASNSKHTRHKINIAINIVECSSLCWLLNGTTVHQCVRIRDAATHVTHSKSCNHRASVFECWTIEVPKRMEYS